MVSALQHQDLAPQIRAAHQVEQSLRGAGVRFCFIGGMALFRWAEPRLTVDVDLTIACPFGAEDKVLPTLQSILSSRIPDALSFAQSHRVFLAHHEGIGVDVSLGALDFELRAIDRASPHLYAPGIFLTTCSAEDLIVFKAFANRPQDWVDIESTIIRQGPGLNWDLVLRELAPLAALKEEPEIMQRLLAVRAKRIS